MHYLGVILMLRPSLPALVLFEGEHAMHEIVIALIFVGMVACPAVFAALPRNEAQDQA
jgi:hypothetical protein